MFFGCTVPLDSKETELGTSDQEAFPSAYKNTGVVLVSCHAWKCVPITIPSGVDISKISECHLLRQISSQGHKTYFKNLSLVNSQSSFDFDLLMKVCKPDNFESHDSLNLALLIFEVFIQALLNVNLSLNQTLLAFLLYVGQTLMTRWFWYFLFEVLSSFNLKGFCYSCT